MANVPNRIPLQDFCHTLLVMLSSADRAVCSMYTSKEAETSLVHFEEFLKVRKRMTAYLRSHSPAYDDDLSVLSHRSKTTNGYRVGVIGTKSVLTLPRS